ncbi:MAG: ABC transporter permease [Promethearchaeota archaeon]
MKLADIIKNNFSQIIALTEKDLKVSTRLKIPLLLSFISPVLGIIMPLIIMGKIFSFNEELGPWNAGNFLVYQFTATNISLLLQLTRVFSGRFKEEKYWETLAALIIAPFHRVNLLLGIFISHIIITSIPFTIFFILCYIFYPISIITVIFVLFTYFLIALIFSGIGLMLGIFAISRENTLGILSFIISLFFMFSCIAYPFEVFPEFVQNFVIFNPFFHVFLFLRMLWIDDNVMLTLSLYPIQFLFIVGFATIGPIIGIIIFNKIYNKYGIVGY